MFKGKIQRSIILTIPTVLFFSISNAFAIAKCQDAEGKWHYGDMAAAACDDVKITILNDKGRKIDEVDVPMTDEELRAKKAEEERLELERKQIEKREMEKKRILAIYPNEESVIRSRDEKLKGMDRIIGLQGDLLGTMRLELKRLEAKDPPAGKKQQEKLQSRVIELRGNIQDYNLAINKLRREREQAAEKFKEILIEYRELTGVVADK